MTDDLTVAETLRFVTAFKRELNLQNMDTNGRMDKQNVPQNYFTIKANNGLQ